MKRRFGWLLENLGWKALALGGAFALWWLVASEPEYSAFVRAPIVYENIPDDLEISAEPANAVSLEVRGPSRQLAALSAATGDRPAVILDMRGAQTGEKSFPIEDGMVRLPAGVRLVRSVPAQARFEFEPRGARRVAVTPRFTGNGERGYGIESFSVEPKELAVVGPASRVARIAFVMTDRVDVSPVVGAAEFRVNAFVDDPFVRFEGSPQVTVTITMKKK